jgi:hypothetical protein
MIIKIGLIWLVLSLVAAIFMVWAIMTAVEDEDEANRADRYWSEDND